MKKEKQVRSYQRRTKSGKVVTVKAHTASYEAAEKAKEAAKKKGAGEELEDIKKNRLPKPVGSGSNGPAPETEPAFTAAEFKEWYHGTGSAADKKVAKALRAQLGRAGYRKFEDEAIDNYSSRGHLSMFKKLSSMSESPKVAKSEAKSPNKSAGEDSSKKTGNSVGLSYAQYINWARMTGDHESTSKSLRKALGKRKYDKFVDEATTTKGSYNRLLSMLDDSDKVSKKASSKTVKDIENLKSNWANSKPVQIDKNTWRPSNFKNDTSGAYDMVSKEATERLISSQIKKANSSKGKTGSKTPPLSSITGDYHKSVINRR